MFVGTVDVSDITHLNKNRNLPKRVSQNVTAYLRERSNDVRSTILVYSTAMLEVTILDVNDNPPIFAPDIYPASVLEVCVICVYQ